MATKTELVNRTLRLLGVTRFGQETPGTLGVEVRAILDAYLLSLNEEVALDFDPTDESVPDERDFHLMVILSQLAGPGFGKPLDERILDRYERKLFAAVLGESDFVEPTTEDF